MFPDTVLRTERLRLRPVTPDDAHDTSASCANPDTAAVHADPGNPFRP
ncbi:hypothetical protein [Actinacidiphila sp. bgisy167]